MGVILRTQASATPTAAEVLTDASIFRLGYRPALDGLRAIFTLLVLGHHMQIPFLTGGFLGVDGFFVLSGFLITALLLEEWDKKGTIRLSTFYARRALRLFPALYTLLFVVALYTLVSGGLMRSADIGAGIAATVFYISNWVVAFHPLHYDIMGWLAVTWSLAVEEQFYLLWPLLLGFLLLRLPRRTLVMVVSGLLGFTVVWRTVLGVSGASFFRVYVGTDTRADDLLIGCVLALLLVGARTDAWPRLRRYAGWAFVAALPVLGWLVATATGQESYLYFGPGATLVGAGVGALLLHLLLVPNGFAARLLAWRPLVGIGRISYAVYLWHMVVFTWIPAALPPWVFQWIPDTGWSVNLLRLILALGIGLLSYYIIELPVLQLKTRLSQVVRPSPAIQPVPIG
jgi:peptidoglycan/LPS O-acetylase OafA/YrhL